MSYMSLLTPLQMFFQGPVVFQGLQLHLDSLRCQSMREQRQILQICGQCCEQVARTLKTPLNSMKILGLHGKQLVDFGFGHHRLINF